MTDRRQESRKHQSGYAIAAVSFIGMIAMTGAASMMSTAPVAEVAEIEHNLLQVRGHWASIGMFSYAISRGRHDGACAIDCTQGDTTRAASYQAYVEEIYNARNNQLTTNNPRARRWTYDEISADYSVDMLSTVSDLNTAVLDGKLLFETELDGIGDFLAGRKTTVESAATRAEICAGLAAATDACLTTIVDTNNSGIVRVQDFRITRP